MNNMQPDFSTLSYRLDGIEKQLSTLQGQLQHYVPVRENELQLRAIQESVKDIKTDVNEIRKQINDISQKMIDQEKSARDRDNAQRESQDKLQIRTLWYIVSAGIGLFLTIAGALIIFYVTSR
jgi:predicted phage tail protein